MSGENTVEEEGKLFLILPKSNKGKAMHRTPHNFYNNSVWLIIVFADHEALINKRSEAMT